MKMPSPIIFKHRCCVLIALTFAFFAVTAARAVTLVQDFYLPMPEQQIYQANSSIISGTGQTNFSTFSIVVTGTGTVIYYDQWEDGYETDLANPTQSTTQVWGDGNDANGIPPGFAHDPQGLVAGTVITLTNNVPLPRNPGQILWDARDHVAANKALVISRAAWPIPTGPVFAGAVGVLSTMDYGTNYVSPVGQDMTNNLFKYVGMFIMAAQNNTSITLDPNGNGVGTSTIVLNQGESYLINGGVKKGGRVTATKPIQADLLIGHVGASYASDWFTLYPVSAWDNTYYTPVSSASSGTQPAYVYLYNPNTNAIVISYNTRAGSGSFSIPGTNGVYQFQMPIASGASFTSQGGQTFFAICTVAANNTSDTSYNWGFTLVPKAALTTEASVGWGPGSSDGSVDGSPVWVTTLGNTTIYVDYKGDHSGPLTDPLGNKYDTNFTVVNLQSLKIYDPSKNQTGMRVYTVDGTLLTAAWGEDADKAQPGNPYIDAGTTVLPFPVPVLHKSVTIVTDTVPTGLSIGDTLQYTVEVDNKGLLPLGNTIVIDAPSTNLTYVANSTTWNGSSIPDSATGTAFPLDAPGFTIPIILSQGSSTFTYLYKINAAGVVSNSVNIGGTPITTMTTLAPLPTNGASVTLNFTDTNGVNVASYAAGANVYVTMTNTVGNTASNSQQTIYVTVTDTNTGDAETIALLETGNNTGIFRNVAGLPTSLTQGLASQNGILNVAAGDTLNVSYTDPVYFDSASATATIQTPARSKQLYLSVNNSTNGTQALNRIDPVAYAHSPTRTSVDIGSGGSLVVNSIGVDNSYATNSTSTSFAFNYATGAGSNRLMLVSVGVQNDSGSAPSISAVTYNGATLNLVASAAKAGGNPKYSLSIYALTNPATGTASVSVNWSGGNSCIVGVSTFTNVNQSTPFNSTNTAAPGATITVNSATNQLVFGAIYNNGNVALAGGQSAVTRWTNNYSGTYYALGNTVAGSNSPTTSITWNTSAYAVGVSINPSSTLVAGSGGPTTNNTSFVQTPAFALPFTMPAGGALTITNFITLTNGSFSANPSVTATLQTNGVNFLTLTNPVFTAGGGVTNLVWSSTITSNTTLPAGAIISYVVSNNVAGTAFHVNYDSTSAPSEIVLPASTVIAVSTFGIYDAPYPGGSIVTTPTAGSTLYVRANVTDPFGAYDITSLGLAFTGPSTGDNFNVNLNDASVVTTNASSKTYEYVWNTGTSVGGWNIAATANEGTEGVTTVASAGLTTIFLDLGTPSTTEFTSGNNGAATNSYLATSSVCVRVTDLDRNTNAATVQNIVATISSSSGDSEIITLSETGTNTGIFTSCINTSTNSNAAPNDGTLYAPVGSVLTASYTDPTDSSDTSSATATIQPIPGVPGVLMTKTILSPSGGQVGVGQPVTYNLQVVNIGSTTLPSLKITDTFTSSKLSYFSASVTPDTIAVGSLTWNNLGAFIPGQSTNIIVTFTTTAIGTATNSATANGSSATNSSSVTLAVNSAAVNVVKTLLTPTNQPVSIQSNVVFRITVQNVGNTAINYLPMEDNFSGVYYQYVSSTIPTNSAGFGVLIWTNLVGATPLATNAIITNDVTMKVVGQGSPANNTAVVDFATDIYGNPVPATSSTVGVTTSSAGVSGYVYNDINQSGVFTNGDTGLANVTLELYTDPTGTGTPGTLVQITTSDANGYYELLNLTMGKYVVVETDLPGYSSSAPLNNRLALNLTNLVTVTNNNFFDYVPAPSVYSTFSGTVFNDVLGTGVNTNQSGVANVTIDVVQDVNSNGVADVGEPVVSTTVTDTNGNYSLAGITPGHYVLRETDLYGYYSTGDSQPPNNNQISFVTTNGITATNNFFFDRLSPVANLDTNSALLQIPVILYPLTNDVSPNGDPLTITSVSATGGTVVINPGATNLTFTPTNLGVAIINYSIADTHGGTNSSAIIVDVATLADLAVGKTAAASVLASNNVTYTISFTNIGPTLASSVTITDALPANTTFVSATGGGVNNSGIVTWNLGDLTNGYTGSVTVTVTAPASGSLTNTASIGSPSSDPNPTNNVTPPVVTMVTPQADLSIVKTGPANIPATTNFTYTISVTNFGPSDASSVVVTDALPANVTFVSASDSGTNSAGVVTWNLGTLTNGQSSNLTVTVTSPASGSLTNIAGVSSPTGDPTPTNNVTPPVVTGVSPVADLGLGKTGPASVVYGSNFTYTISVTNFGPSTATGILVTDSLPVGLSFISAVPSATTNAGNQVVWTNIISLVSGAKTNLTLTVAPNSTGTASNTASVGSPVSDPNPTNNTTPPVITTVTPGQPVVTWPNPASIVYGTPLGTNQNDATASVPGTFVYSPTNGAVLPVGTNTLSVVFTPTDTNYATTNLTVPLVVTPALLTVTANSTNKIYGAANPVFTANITGFVNSENSSVISGSPSLTTSATTNSGVGSYPIVATNGTLSAANYVFSFVNGTLTVSKTVLTVTANSTNKVYGAANPAFTASYSGFVNGDTSSVLSGAPSLTTTATTNSGVGSYTITATNTTLSAANYSFAFVNGMLTVSAATLTVTANSTNKVYGAANPAFTASYSGFVNGDTSAALSGSPSLTTTATTNSGVGAYPIVATNGTLSAANYSFTFVNGTLTVNAATLTVTANNTNRLYNTANPTFTASYSGFVNGENSSVLSGSPSLTTTAILSSPAGTYPINATNGTLSAANYSFSFVGGTLTIIGGNYGITWTNPASIVYGALLGTNENNASATVSGSYVYNPTNGTLLPAGTNLLSVIFTPDDTNYAATNLSVQIIVTPAPLTITANSTNKTYNTTLNLGTTAFGSSGLVNSETVGGVTLASAGTVASAPVGTYPITPSNAAGGTFNPANYSITYSNGTLTVMAAAYTATWPMPTNIVYGTALDTNQNDATASIGGTFTYNPTNGTVLPAGTNMLAALFTPTDTNYSSTNLSVQLIITPAPLTITADSTNKIYNTTLTLGSSQTAFTSSGLVNGDTVTNVTLASSGAIASAPVGTYPIIPSAAVGNGLTNYTIGYSNGTLTVLTGNYGITWTNPSSIVYGTPLGTNQNDATASVPGTFVYSPTNGAVLPVGTNTLNVVFTPTDTNYTATNLIVQIVVTPALLTVTANSTNKIYGAANPAFTASYSGFVNGENSSVISGSPGLTSTATTNSGVGAYPIVATNGKLSAANYSFTFVNGTLTVGQAALSVTANDQVKNYGTTLTLGAGQTAFTSSGLKNGETIGSVTLTASGGTNAAAAPGAYTITPSAATGGTFAATNYLISYLNGSLTVTQSITADLAVFKTGPTNGVAGSNLVYTITVTNIGPNGATNIIVQDILPAGLNFVSATPANVTNYIYTDAFTNGTAVVLSNVVTWASFNLPAHGKTNLTITVRSAEGGTFTNIATATSDAYDPNPTNNDGTATNSQVVTVVTPRADVAVFKTGGTNAFAGGVSNYTITVTNLGPSTASNVVVKDNLPAGTSLASASGSYSVSNNVVTWAAMTLSNGATASFTISLTVPLTGSFTNIALSTSTTPDPNATNNNGTANNSHVAVKILPSADVVVYLVGPPSVVQGSNFVYTLTVSNAGPSTASNVVASDTLPLGLAFVSASSGGKNTNGTITWPNVKSLVVGAFTNYTLTVNATTQGLFTNIASAVSTTYDPNPTNNSGVTPSSRVLTDVSVAQFGILAGTPVLNPQTGLFEEQVTVTNNAAVTILGFRLHVGGLTNGVTLYNASGTSNNVPFINYNFPVDPSNTVTMTLEFYDPTRQPFSNTLWADAILPSESGSVSTNGSVAVSRVFMDTRVEGDTRFVIEFASVPGKTYAIIYSSDLETWKTATPSVKASGNVTQWYDDGPPVTESKPTSVTSRYYRVIQY